MPYDLTALKQTSAFRILDQKLDGYSFDNLREVWGDFGILYMQGSPGQSLRLVGSDPSQGHRSVTGD